MWSILEKFPCRLQALSFNNSVKAKTALVKQDVRVIHSHIWNVSWMRDARHTLLNTKFSIMFAAFISSEWSFYLNVFIINNVVSTKYLFSFIQMLFSFIQVHPMFSSHDLHHILVIISLCNWDCFRASKCSGWPLQRHA